MSGQPRPLPRQTSRSITLRSTAEENVYTDDPTEVTIHEQNHRSDNRNIGGQTLRSNNRNIGEQNRRPNDSNNGEENLRSGNPNIGLQTLQSNDRNNGEENLRSSDRNIGLQALRSSNRNISESITTGNSNQSNVNNVDRSTANASRRVASKEDIEKHSREYYTNRIGQMENELKEVQNTCWCLRQLNQMKDKQLAIEYEKRKECVKVLQQAKTVIGAAINKLN